MDSLTNSRQYKNHQHQLRTAYSRQPIFRTTSWIGLIWACCTRIWSFLRNYLQVWPASTFLKLRLRILNLCYENAKNLEYHHLLHLNMSLKPKVSLRSKFLTNRMYLELTKQIITTQPPHFNQFVNCLLAPAQRSKRINITKVQNWDNTRPL